MFAGWFAGAMDWVSDQNRVATRAVSRETQCASEGADHCVFTVTPLA
jgi:predicted hydrocarbon binding protein